MFSTHTSFKETTKLQIESIDIFTKVIWLHYTATHKIGLLLKMHSLSQCSQVSNYNFQFRGIICKAYSYWLFLWNLALFEINELYQTLESFG